MWFGSPHVDHCHTWIYFRGTAQSPAQAENIKPGPDKVWPGPARYAAEKYRPNPAQ